MPRTDYSIQGWAPLGVFIDEFLTDGNLDSNDPTIPAHRIAIVWNLSTTGGFSMVFQRETLPNLLLNGRARIFYKMTNFNGTDVGIFVALRSFFPTNTTYLLELVTTAGGTIARISRMLNGTVTVLALLGISTLTVKKGTLVGEVVGTSPATLKVYATVVPLTDPDATAYVTTPPLQLSFTDTSPISTAGKFGFGMWVGTPNGLNRVEYDRFHVFEIT
jgi:PKD repeat protein